MQVHARPPRRSCECVGLSRAAWYRPQLDWTVRDDELVAALARLVEPRQRRESQADPPGLQGDATEPATRGEAAPPQACMPAALRATLARHRLVG